MKTLFLAILLFLSAVAAGAQNRAEQLRNKLLSRDSSTVMVVAHRGDWRYQPENSIPAIEHSIKVGVDVVEVDLQKTRDSVLILMHDATLDRTTTGKGKVSDWPIDSIKKLYLKSGCDIKTMHRVPTLEEAMLAVKGKVLINLDKADRYFPQVMKVLEKTGTTRQVIMKGSKPAQEVVKLYGKYLNDIIYMPVVKLNQDNISQRMEDYVSLLHPTAIEMVWNAKTPVSVPLNMRQIVKGHSLIWYNTLESVLAAGHDDDMALTDPDEAYGFLIHKLGARIIQTDRAEYLLDYLRRNGLHQ